jgi:glycosyltransferase involved in cell wall biosynthesis
MQKKIFLISKIKKLIHYLKREGFLKTVQRIRFLYTSHVIEADEYRKWIADVEATLPAPDFSALMSGPLISVLMPVFRPNVEMLDQAIESVAAQSYENWELCIADDASNEAEIRNVLESWMNRDKRIRVVFREVNGHISAASNSALAIANGVYMVLLDHDDLLVPDTLAHLVQAAIEEPLADILYADEDHIDEFKQRVRPFFKPGWSPTLLWSQAYLGHPVMIRLSLVETVGGFRSYYDGSQDQDLMLRVGAIARKVVHVPRVLYHWREHAESTAGNPDSKPYAHDAGRRAVEDFLKLQYADRLDKVEDGVALFTYRPIFKLPKTTKVSIVIPTKDKIDLLSRCIDSIINLSTHVNFEILVIDNNSIERETEAYLNRITLEDARVKTIKCPIPFNWSRLNNIGANHTQGEVLVFLNNDIEIITPGWLELLCGTALLNDVGLVGPMLSYPDGSIQHAGVVVGMGGWADHIFKCEMPIHRTGPFVSPVISRDVLGVTGACTVIERSKYQALGGYDETFIICGSDVELGLRAHNTGLRNIYRSDARLYHFESKTRGAEVPDNDFKESAIKYEPWRTMKRDPYFHPLLDITSTRPKFSIS